MATMATEPASAARSQLAEYLGTLRRRKWTIVVVTLVAVGAAIGLSKSQTPTYEATASVLLQTSASAVDTALGINSTPYNVADEMERVQSSNVADLVRRKIGTAPGVAVGNPGGTNVIRITATSTSPRLAATIANTYANAYIQQRQTDAIGSYLGAAKVVQAEISKLQGQIAAAGGAPGTTSTTGTPAANGATLATGTTPTTATTPTTVNSNMVALQSQVTLLQQELNTLQTQASVGASGVQVIQPASPPTRPSSPKTTRNALIALGGGLVLGIALAFLRESLDDTIVSREDLDRTQPGLPVLSVLPAVSGRNKDLVSTTRPHSDAAEAYRSLRTSVQFLGLDQPAKLLQITSPRSAEGKTTVVANLAVTLAAAGLRVVAVDCDLRRSRLHAVFGLSNKEGFTSVLIGQTPLSAALQPVEGHENLSVLTSGERPPNPAELLSGARAGEVFSALERRADMVIVDCPPVLPVTDAVLIATSMDATLLVVSSGTTTGKDLSGALEVLGQVDAPVVGVVLNALETNAGYRYRYRYSYSYEPRHSVPADRA
jgi:capsular exopolysaccharide synthesis family protein